MQMLTNHGHSSKHSEQSVFTLAVQGRLFCWFTDPTANHRSHLTANQMRHMHNQQCRPTRQRVREIEEFSTSSTMTIRYYSYVLVYFYGTETPHDGGCTDLRFSILNFFLCKALWHDASHSMTGSTVFGYSEEICCTCPYADKKHRFSSKACSSTNASTMQNNRMHAKLPLLGFSSFRPSKFAWLHIGYAPCSHASKMKTFP